MRTYNGSRILAGRARPKKAQDGSGSIWPEGFSEPAGRSHSRSSVAEIEPGGAR
jgi:hypothetical protein